ncbi:hypothetical protein PILCRDRAFT_11323 [Piloderma croceum F 1598]|uniref:Fungal-type protein kinase domain-containing protein n=1 Tax=Piloderma croceum (strain F 1598) TaxID=765440 RepID=A0A0C3FEP5_PILCF|nr:hypothetical protein PILCRDRAFT_11323 [Piloderma croceum F 1598]
MEAAAVKLAKVRAVVEAAVVKLARARAVVEAVVVAPYSERHSGARPDGYFDDITVAAEFRKDDKPAAVTDVAVHQCDADGKVIGISYLTTRLLYDSGAEALRGRGTRVFEAYRLEGDKQVGAPVTIKDVWVDDDRQREGTTIACLLEEASEDDKPLVKQYFLTVLSEGDVRIGNKVDDTRELIMRQQDIPSGERFWLPDKSSELRSGHISDIGLTASWDEYRHTRAPSMTPEAQHNRSP